MNAAAGRRRTFGLAVLLLTGLTGCLATAGGPEEWGGAQVSYGVGFYEPRGYDYGGWAPDYRVGPPRGDRERNRHSSGSVEISPRAPAYRPAPASRSFPMLPPRQRPMRH